MLCPDCKRPAPGGTTCPGCGQPIPGRESFGGQGGHYLLVLSAISLIVLAGTLVALSREGGMVRALHSLLQSGWIWLYVVVGLAPTGIGLYYWILLREEEIAVTDAAIERRSHWGDERLAWADLRAFRRVHMLPRQTRVGWVATLSRVLANRRVLAKFPPVGYELVGPEGDGGQPVVMRLEPGTIEDMSWLLQIIEERVGPPTED